MIENKKCKPKLKTTFTNGKKKYDWETWFPCQNAYLSVYSEEYT